MPTTLNLTLAGPVPRDARNRRGSGNPVRPHHGSVALRRGDVKDFADNPQRIGILIKELTTYLHGTVSRLARAQTNGNRPPPAG
jgi:hypothetical protein